MANSSPIADITDGTSNTIYVVESAGRPYLYQNGVVANQNIFADQVLGGGWCRPATDIWIVGFADSGSTIPGGPYTINAANGVDTVGVYPSQVPAGAATGTDGTGQCAPGMARRAHPQWTPPRTRTSPPPSPSPAGRAERRRRRWQAPMAPLPPPNAPVNRAPTSVQ